MRIRLLLLACTVLFANASLSNAQTPNTGMEAVGADFGVIFPDDVFETAPVLDGFFEHYLTPRTGVRLMLGWTSPGFENRTEDHFRQVKLLVNLTYNWEGGQLHPFVTGGAGAYFLRLKREDRPDPDGETRGGINLGGGAEYFVTGRTTVKGEGRWDIVSHPTGFPDATAFTLTMGVKHYF